MKKTLGILLLISVFATGCSHYGKKDCGKRMEKKFSKLDTNGDGSISKKEFDGRHADKWAKMDADKDGKVTMEEMKAYKKAHKKDCKKKKCKGC